MEFVQNRYGNGTIGKRCQEGYSPTALVASAQGNLVSLLDACGFKHDVKLLDDACHILVLEGEFAVIAHRVLGPVVADAVCQRLIQTLW